MAYKTSKEIVFNKITNDSKDYLFLKGEIGGSNINLIIVYFSVNDPKRNGKLKTEIEQHIERYKDTAGSSRRI